MSKWRIAVKRLYARGGSATLREIDDGSFGHKALNEASNLGLCMCDKSIKPPRWELTRRGRLFCEGKMAAINRGCHKMFWTSTWLNSLPQGVSMQMKCSECQRAMNPALGYFTLLISGERYNFHLACRPEYAYLKESTDGQAAQPSLFGEGGQAVDLSVHGVR